MKLLAVMQENANMHAAYQGKDLRRSLGAAAVVYFMVTARGNVQSPRVTVAQDKPKKFPALFHDV